MKKLTLWIIALAALPGSAFAQNITGTWQGALKAGPQELRIVVKISTTDKDKLTAITYSIDQGTQPIPASAFTRDGSTVKWTITAIDGSYEGKVSGDGNSITGTWNQGVTRAPEPDSCHAGDRLDHSGTSASAQADGSRCESGVRSRHDQARQTGGAFFPYREPKRHAEHHQYHGERPD